MLLRIHQAPPLLPLTLFTLLAATGAHAAPRPEQARVDQLIARTIQPLMQQYQIPGMAVAVTIQGKSYVYNAGIASKITRQPVSQQTLFEIGSVSKTFAGTLASLAQLKGALSWSAPISQYLPELKGSQFDHIRVLNAATHTTGLPLQIPEQLKNNTSLMNYLKNWRPASPAGTQRVYSNMGIGLLGMSAANSLGGSFPALVKQQILQPLGMKNSYYQVPAARMKDYAQGYSVNNLPVRVSPGLMADPAYGLKTCTNDLIRYLAANMGQLKSNTPLQQALTNTHSAYFKTALITQDVVWEQYPMPVTLKTLKAGNSAQALSGASQAITPPLKPMTDVLINKTGNTNGFSSYVAFIPAKQIGVVLLANKPFPLADRVSAGYQILSQLGR